MEKDNDNDQNGKHLERKKEKMVQDPAPNLDRSVRKTGPLCKDGSFLAPANERVGDDGVCGPFMPDGSFVSPPQPRAPPKPKQGPLMRDETFKTTSDSDLAKMRIRDDILDNQRAPPPLEDLPFLSAPLLAAGKKEVESAPAVSDVSDNVIPAPPTKDIQEMGLPLEFGSSKKMKKKKNGRRGELQEEVLSESAEPVGSAEAVKEEEERGEPSNRVADANIGVKLMLKMGYRRGGLGPQGQGILEPIELVRNNLGTGLGYE